MRLVKLLSLSKLTRLLVVVLAITRSLNHSMWAAEWVPMCLKITLFKIVLSNLSLTNSLPKVQFKTVRFLRRCNRQPSKNNRTYSHTHNVSKSYLMIRWVRIQRISLLSNNSSNTYPNLTSW